MQTEASMQIVWNKQMETPDPPAEQRQVQQAQVSLPEQLQLLLAASGQQQLLCSTGAAQELVRLD